MSAKMIRSSKCLMLLVTVAAVIASFVPVFAGGWAVITLDELPAEVVAGEPLKIGLTVRQHGNHPMEGLTATISLRNAETGEAFVVDAVPEGEPGHYVAELNFPSGGNWTWSIQAFTMDQPMPPLNVVTAINSGAAATPSSVPPGMVVGVFGLIATLGSVVMVFRRRTMWSMAAILAGVIISASGFVSASGQPIDAEVETKTAPSQAEIGEALFTAKGCLTCHNHAKTNSIGEMHLGMGPDLTNYSPNPELLRSWLSNPPALKPDTEMPNLELDEREIEALIAFLATD